MIRVLFVILSMAVAGGSFAAGGGNENLDSVYINLDDRESLQKGAKTFANYCLSCHGIKFMRYNRMADDLGISEEVLRANFLQPSQKPGDQMDVNMSEEDAKRWFGTVPPDLSLTARSRSPEWIYTYLRSFHADENSVTGWNNDLFEDVAMPHVLYKSQGDQSPEEYNEIVRELTNFLVYVAEPVKLIRYSIGIWVLIFMGVFTVIAYFLKKEFWKDIH